MATSGWRWLQSYVRTTTLTDCTVSGNTAGNGGGLATIGGTTTATNTTSAATRQSDGGGLSQRHFGSTVRPI